MLLPEECTDPQTAWMLRSQPTVRPTHSAIVKAASALCLKLCTLVKASSSALCLETSESNITCESADCESNIPTVCDYMFEKSIHTVFDYESNIYAVCVGLCVAQ